MARAIKKLTAVAVRGMSRPGLYADGGGLYLQVTERGAKTWIFRFMLNGRRRDMGLGAVHTISLAEARDEALRCRRMVREKTDPIDARKVARSEARAEAIPVLTFKECAEASIKRPRRDGRTPCMPRNPCSPSINFPAEHWVHLRTTDEIDKSLSGFRAIFEGRGRRIGGERSADDRHLGHGGAKRRQKRPSRSSNRHVDHPILNAASDSGSQRPG